MFPLFSPSSPITLFTLLAAISWAGPADAGHVLKFGGPEDRVLQQGFDQVSHADYDALLRHYVDDRGDVCYRKWAEHGCDVRRLGAYLCRLSHVDPSLPASRDAIIAYHINAYNALTLWGILDSYPVVSIQRLDGERSPYAIFDDLQLWVGGRFLSLNGIENEVLRPMRDPRVHFALVCAARGCPRLRNEAYAASRLDWQLTDNAVEFFAKKQRFHISQLSKKVKISPILKWYREDFGASDGEVIATVFPFLPEQDRCWLAAHPGWCLRYLGYDWSLNDGCPALSVAMGRVPYGIYAKISPMLQPLLSRIQGGDESPAPSTTTRHVTSVPPESPGIDHSGDLLPVSPAMPPEFPQLLSPDPNPLDPPTPPQPHAAVAPSVRNTRRPGWPSRHGWVPQAQDASHSAPQPV